MSDIHPITWARYNDLEKAGLIDENQIYQIYDTEEDIAQELMLTRKALEIIKKEMSKETMPDFAVIHNALKMAEQKDVK